MGLEFLIAIVWTIILLGLIVLACTVFTNAVEWLGRLYNLSEGAVGSVLAAVGTALPETIVPIVAIVAGAMNPQAGTGHGGGGHDDVGIGAIIGAPFMLSTLAMFVTGAALLFFTWRKKRASSAARLDKSLFKRDFHYFFLAFGIAVAAAFLPPEIHWFRWVLCIASFLIYGVYVYQTLKMEGSSEHHDLEPLMFQPKAETPTKTMALLQTFACLGAIVLLAHAFVEHILHLSTLLKVPALVLSLIIIPIATELPEKFNSVVWIGQGKDNLAMGNITGAMVFQSCIPTAIGMIFTPWVLDSNGVAGVVLCLLSSLTLYFFAFRWHERYSPYVLLSGGVYYLGFLIYVLYQMSQQPAVAAPAAAISGH
jgi:cation:H+ antiporter